MSDFLLEKRIHEVASDGLPRVFAEPSVCQHRQKTTLKCSLFSLFSFMLPPKGITGNSCVIMGGKMGGKSMSQCASGLTRLISNALMTCCAATKKRGSA